MTNRLQLGAFGMNLAPGITFTTISGALTTDWPRVRALAQPADRMGFEAIIPIARWKGYGGKRDPHGSSFDTLASAAAIGEATENADVVAGWYRPELEMFGGKLDEHDRRYDLTAEWTEILLRLWT